MNFITNFFTNTKESEMLRKENELTFRDLENVRAISNRIELNNVKYSLIKANKYGNDDDVFMVASCLTDHIIVKYMTKWYTLIDFVNENESFFNNFNSVKSSLSNDKLFDKYKFNFANLSFAPTGVAPGGAQETTLDNVLIVNDTGKSLLAAWDLLESSGLV